MKNHSSLAWVLSAVVLMACIGSATRLHAAQDPQTNPPGGPPQDPITQLNLTPEQRQKIRAIREQNKEERAGINQRLREANIALEQTLDADNPNEAEVEQRLKDLAAAQAASNRMRVLTELRIRHVLTPDQLSLWRSLRQQAAERRQQNGNQRRVRPVVEDLRPTQRNGMNPLFPRRNPAAKNPRP